MKNITFIVIVISACEMLLVFPARSQAAVAPAQASGKVVLLRVHDVETKYGPTGDEINVEVVIWLDTQPKRAFGFQLRNDGNRPVRQGMLDLLRDAFNNRWTVTINYVGADGKDPDPGKSNFLIIRTWVTGNSPPPMAYEYAAKFVCGKSTGEVLPLGTFFTAVNVRNPGDEPISFTKRFAVALPAEKPGPVTRPFPARLGAHEAFEIDCADIFKHTQAQGGFLKGFVVIESRHELEVVVVYSAARLDDGQVATEHIERVPARLVQPKLPDLAPVPDDQGSFCRLRGDRLVVEIVNKGTDRAAASTTEVDFLDGTKKTADTPSLDPGEPAELLFETPAGFRREGVHNFLITADVLLEVVEADEGNNTANGQCIVID